MGFVLQARKYSKRFSLGHFRINPTHEMSLSSCATTNDTVVGWLDSPRHSLTFTWQAPALDAGPLHFAATVFKDRTRFYQNVTSHSFLKGFTPIDLSSCGSAKGCFRYVGKSQEDCASDTCEYLVTFQRNGQDATFELSTSAQWAAIGFSSDKNMGGDDVLMCLNSVSGMEISHYYNDFQHQVPTKQPTNTFTNQQIEISENMRLNCRFTRPMKIEGDSKSVDLNNDWYQLYAWGPLGVAHNPLSHSLDSPPTSEFKVTLSPTYDARGSSRRPVGSRVLQLVFALIPLLLIGYR